MFLCVFSVVKPFFSSAKDDFILCDGEEERERHMPSFCLTNNNFELYSLFMIQVS